MNEERMSFVVDLELGESISEAAQAEHRPVEQVLQELMQEYLMRRAKAVVGPAGAITAAERLARQEAVDSARASLSLEGFRPSKIDEAHERRYIAGEIDLATFVKTELLLSRGR